MQAIDDAQYAKSDACIRDIRKQYQRAIDDIERDIAVWYQRVTENNEISYSAARRMLKNKELDEFRWTVEEYIKRGEENALNQRWMKELENASARVHISRLEAIKLQLRQHAEELAASLNVDLSDLLGDVYEGTFYRTSFEMSGAFGVGANLARINTRRIDMVLNTPWAQDGKTFSDRIWAERDKLTYELHSTLAQGVIRGTAPRKMAADLAKRMGVSRSQAERLVMTETAAIASKSRQDAYKALDVEEFEVCVTLDSRTCQTCRPLDGLHYPMSQYTIGETAPPFHPRCRCTTVPYFDDEFTEDELRASRDANDQGYVLVPSNMTYQQWKDSFVKDAAATATKVVAGAAVDGIITSGARITDPDSPEAEAFAEMYYEEVRHFTTDVEKIAQNTGVSEENVRKIKAYLFEKNSLYDEYTKSWRRFDPDCAIAQSWQRLMIGKDIKPHDRTLIRHELLEMEIKASNPGISHDEAHNMASKRFDYNKEARKYYVDLKEHKKGR